MSAGSDFTGDLEDVEQEPAGPAIRMPAVPVEIDGPVPVQTVGSRAGASFSKLLLSGDVVQLMGSDVRRRVAQIMSIEANFYIGTDQASVAHEVAALWPGLVACPISHQDEVWVKVAGDATLSVMVENWAD